jgi:hypothetical protein
MERTSTEEVKPTGKVATNLKWRKATALTRMRFGSNGATAPYELGLPSGKAARKITAPL